MYLSYSGHKTYVSCPRAYAHRYILKTNPPVPENKVNSLYGTVVGQLFELLYAEKLYLGSGIPGLLAQRAGALLDAAIARESRTGCVNFRAKEANYKSREALLEDILNSIARGLGIIGHHSLLPLRGTEPGAEVKLDRTWGEHTVGGRADFILTRVGPHRDTVILDGKGSKWRDKYVDLKQLHWYAMLYQEHHGKLPDKLGFVFWRSEPEDAVDWHDADPEKLLELRAEVGVALTAITQATAELQQDPKKLPVLFPARTDKFGCKMCPYQPSCAEGTAYLAPVAESARAVEMLNMLGDTDGDG